MSTESMHRALLFSMKPMPPMSAARLNTMSVPSVACVAASCSLQVEDEVLGTPSWHWYQPSNGFRSTERTWPAPSSWSRRDEVPPDEAAAAGDEDPLAAEVVKG